MALHGVMRGTLDVDVAIQWSLKNLQNAESALKGMGLVSLIPITAETVFQFRDDYINKRNLIAWNFYDPAKPLNQVDIIINYEIKSAQDIERIKTSLGTISVLSINELIKMKEASGRLQDLKDVEKLRNL